MTNLTNDSSSWLTSFLHRRSAALAAVLASSAKAKRSKKASLRPSFESFEALEPRSLLSGSVMATMVDGSLIIVGDATANAIVMDQAGLSAGQVRISGENNTSVNGQSESVVMSGLTEAVFIRMGSGNDSVTIGQAIFAGNVRVNLGAGDDAMTINDSSFHGSVGVNGGNGKDVVRIDSAGDPFGPSTLFDAPLTIRLGSGDDTLQVGVTGQTGNHTIFASRVLFGGGPGYDTLLAFESSSHAASTIVNFEVNTPSPIVVIPDTTAPTALFTDPDSGAIGVPLNQILAVSFSEAMDPLSINASDFTLTGPGGASVQGTVSYAGNVATFVPANALSPNTTYTATLSTTAHDLAGNALAGNLVWIFTTGTVADSGAPTVSFIDPANNATGVALNKKIAATFSEAMDPLTITTANVTVTAPGAVPVTGSVAYVGTTMTFTPNSNLAPNTTFIVTVTTGVRDLTGNALANNFVWSFTTGATPDSAAPTVSFTDPAINATNVALNKKIAAVFSEAMDPATVTTTSFRLTGPGSSPVIGAVTYFGTVATFTPSSALAPNTTFTATVNTGVKDLAGNALAGNFVWSFTTGATPDTAAPTVTSTDPANNAVAVAVNKKVAVVFSEVMDPLTITTANFTLTGPASSSVLGTVTYVGTTATFTPNANLAPNSVFTGTITTGAKDLAGNALASNFIWTFTTGATPDVTAPTVSSIDPANNSTGVALNKKIAATFSEAMDPLTITTANVTVTAPGAVPVLGTVAYVGTTMTFTPTSNLAASTTFIVTITTGAKDLAGNALANNFVWSFTTGATPDITAPTVSLTDPANLETGIALNKKIAAVFSEAMDPLTVNNTSFTVTGPGSTSVFGTVTLVGSIATFTPAVNLASNTIFTVTIGAGVKDLAGNALAAAYVWHFTTGATPDVTAPMVSSTDPANLATGVALNKKIAATFSEVMDPLTITTATFSVTGPGSTPVLGTVTYVGTTATFTPNSNLAPNSIFTATITTGARDLAGNALASNFTWIFTTGTTQDVTAPTVTFIDPANFATGVALNKKVSAAFSEAMDPLTINTSTVTLTAPGLVPVLGTVAYVGTTVTFTPTSNLAPNTTFIATITTGVKDLAGNALATNFTWSFTTGATPDTTAPTVSFTDPANGDTGIALNKKVAVAFSESMDPLTITTASFTLNGPGSNSVLGTVTYVGATATFTPNSNLIASTVYTATITTGAKDLAGNALASNFIWTFTTGATPDTTAPTVSFVDPANHATGVALNKKIAATFSEAMDPLSITNVTFTINGPGSTSVSGTVAYLGTIATFTPNSNLAPNTLFTATITTGARDLAGNALAGNFVWTFTTGAAPDTTAPTVSSVDPLNFATGVALNKKVTATFSEAMDPLTITTSTVKLTAPGLVPVLGTVAYVGTTVTFTPNSNLAPNTTFIATITTGAKDLAGNSLAVNYTWSFTTGATPDTTAPTVISTVPVNNAVGVALNQQVSATFSEAMDPLTITNVTFTVKGPGVTNVPGAVSYVGNTATFAPTSSLAASTLFTATITTTAKDLAGNPLASNFVWHFTTGAAADITAPTVVSVDPLNNETGVATNKHIAATFSEAMDPLTITTAQVTVTSPGPVSVSGTVSYVGTTMTFTPTVALAPSTVFTVTITTGAKDLAGNALASNFVWHFTTGVAPDITAPTVTSTNPLNLQTGVFINKAVTAVFSESMDQLTLGSNYKLEGPGNSLVSGLIGYDSLTNTVTFTPSANLAINTTYTATITGGINGVKDLAGNPMLVDKVWSFTTGNQIAQQTITLGDAGAFAIMATTAISGSGNQITGDVGVNPGSAQGIPPSEITGGIHVDDQTIIDAQAALLSAYNDAVSRSTTSITLPGNMGGLTFTPGLYTNSTSVLISGAGPNNILTLDAQGDSNAIFIFKMGSTLTAGVDSQIVLAGGAKASNVYWQVGTSATLNTGVIFKGNILASVTITVNNGSIVEGRLLAGSNSDGAVTINGSQLTVPAA
jgi:hypothetical protein